MTTPCLYDSDFYAWTQEQSAKLRAGYFSDIHSANIAEELESLGKSQKKELISRLTVLLAHLLKWQYQPDKKTLSGQLTIEEQRDELANHLADNPSLKALLDQSIERAYKKAVRWAQEEILLPKQTFPAQCPYAWAQLIDQSFYPN
jgi:hypothetical protein